MLSSSKMHQRFPQEAGHKSQDGRHDHVIGALPLFMWLSQVLLACDVIHLKKGWGYLISQLQLPSWFLAAFPLWTFLDAPLEASSLLIRTDNYPFGLTAAFAHSGFVFPVLLITYYAGFSTAVAKIWTLVLCYQSNDLFNGLVLLQPPFAGLPTLQALWSLPFLLLDLGTEVKDNDAFLLGEHKA